MSEVGTQATIRVNGTREPLAVGTLGALLEAKIIDTGQRGIAVAINGSVVSRADWAQTRLHPGDAVEIVRALKGG